MSTSIKPVEDENYRKTRPYRFALVGATATGKTCILAQLAMNRDSDERYSSTLSSWDREKLSEKDVKRAATDSEARRKLNYQKGMEELREAAECIREGNAPRGTSPGMTVRLMADYEMGDAERGTFYVSTEDYSGENINASEDALADHNTESYDLAQRLARYDGLILVVDTLLEGEDTKGAEKMVQSLSAFFNTVRKNSQLDWENFPVALIFSKWDKLGPIDFENSETEFEKLKLYKKQEFVLFYNELVKSIRNAAENQEHIGNDDSFRVFPVSAFGKTRKDEKGHDIPEVGTRAFGIVAPFAWLADRCDELNMVALRKDAEKLPAGWKKWLLPNGKLAREVKNRSIFLQNRIPKKKNREQELKEIQKRAQAVGWHALGMKIFLSLTLLIILVWGAEKYAFNVWQDVLDNPQSTPERLLYVKAQVDLAAQLTASLPWVNGPFYEFSDEIDRRLEELLWTPVEQAPGSREKAAKAQEYLDRYPNGTHKAEAEALLAAYHDLLDNNAWKTVTTAATLEQKNICVLRYLELIEKKEIPGEHKADAEHIVKVEYPTYLDDQAAEAVFAIKDPKAQIDAAKDYLIKFPEGKHRKEMEELIRNGAAEIAWLRDCAKYNASRDMADLERNLNNLLATYGKDKWEKIIPTFPNDLLVRLDSENTTADDVDQIANCERAAKILENIENIVRPQSPNLVKGYTEEQGKLSTKRQGLIDKYDRELYAKTPNTIQNCNNYLNFMEPYGGGAMKAQVQALKTYFESLEKTKNFASSKNTVLWGNKITNHNARMEIRINGDLRRSTPVHHVDGKTESIGDFNFNALPNSSVTVDIKVISERNTIYRDGIQLHSGTKTISLRDWCKNGSEAIEIGTNSKVTLFLSGYPKKPEFQTWKKKETK